MSYRILTVKSDEDYGAVSFENKFPKDTWPSIWEEAMSNEDHETERMVKDGDYENTLYITAYEFKQRPEQGFIDLMREEQDYDSSKHENWYEIQL